MEKYLHVLQMFVNDMQKFFNQYIHSLFYNKFEKNPIFCLSDWVCSLNFLCEA